MNVLLPEDAEMLEFFRNNVSGGAEPDGVNFGLLINKLEAFLQDVQCVAKILADKVILLLLRHRLLSQ